MSKSKGNRYDEEFKADAVRLVRSGRSVKEVAKDLGVSYQGLNQWIKKDEENKDPELSRIKELEVQLKAKNKRIADLEETNEILKKVAAIFVKDSQK